MMTRLFLLYLFSPPLLIGADRSLHLPIGDPARRDREAAVVLDAITDTAKGDLISPRDLPSRLTDARLIFLGESHTGMDFHLVQRRVIEELLLSGRKILIGLEMYPFTEQKHLDDWSRGLLTEKGFVQLSHWYKNWGYHWNYYRDIFLLAREKGIRIVAINAPREVVTAVRKKGFQNLTAEETSHIPQKIETSSADHYALFKTFFEEDEGIHSKMEESQWRSMFEAQCTWDATMAYNAVRALEEHGQPDSVMVVLVGSGHVAYGLGIQRQAAQWYRGTTASIIPIRVIDERNRSVETVRASYADFVWGLPPEKDPVYPELGVATVDMEGEAGRKVVSVSKDSVGKAAGFEVADVLLSMDGIALKDRETLNRVMSEKSWGDSAAFVVRREEKEISLQVHFRRRPPLPPRNP